uniref:Lipoprotein n=1 Tax=Echinococcus granulosus TaxID=6210 RepID=A0A068WJT9_ECHGR|nr:hypothetical protein EgrG_001074700 [Echinococcus granulosus]
MTFALNRTIATVSCFVLGEGNSLQCNNNMPSPNTPPAIH